MDKSYKQFVDKLNNYIRKFYLYQLVRGLILFFLLIVFYFSFISVLEFFSYFDPGVKLFIVFFTLFFVFIIFYYFILIPVVKLFGIGNRLNYKHISNQLSISFPEIKDKLINIIELESDVSDFYSIDLKRASIEQKIDELKIYNFSDSIKFIHLKRVLVLFFIVNVIVLFCFIRFPQFYVESSVRLVQFNQKFEKPSPYSFNLENSNLNIISGESIELKLHCVGKDLPDMMFVNLSGNNFLMQRKGDFYYYTIEHLNSSISVYFTDRHYISDIYKVVVLNKPFISSFSVEVIPPVYTNLSVDKFFNVGDLKVASGSVVKWNFNTVDTDSLFLLFGDSTRINGVKNLNHFDVTKNITKDIDYQVIISNSFLQNVNKLGYKISVISDLYPEINVAMINDSVDFKIFHFKGNIIDDYGFHKLELNVNSANRDTIFNVQIVPFLLNQEFYYSFNFESVRNIGKTFKYYFSVYDNDFIHHFKKTISDTFTFTFPDYKEILSKENTDDLAIDNLFKKSVKLTEDIKNEFKNFKLKQVNSNISDWEKFQSVKDIMNKKSELQNVLDQIKQQNQDANNFLNSFSSEKSDVLKKQEQIEELLNEVFTDELKKLFDEFNELAKQFDSKKYEQLSKEMNSNLDNLSDQLERNLQLLKKMKVEQKVQRVIDRLTQLSVDEHDNFNKLDKREYCKVLIPIEKENSVLIENLLKDYKGALDLNKDLEKPINLLDFDKEFSLLLQNFTKIVENLEKNSRKKVISLMEGNNRNIDQLAFAMKQMLSSIHMKQNQEDIENVKQILKNLIIVSFDQEKILKLYATIDLNNPLINEARIKQKNLAGQIAFLKDSVNALSKRTPSVGIVINKELMNLENSAAFAFENLETGNMGEARKYQMYSITASNNLALFLSEVLDHIKEQQKNSQPGDGDCDKPGGKGKSSMTSLKDNEKSIKDQLQKMIDDMKKGDKTNLSKYIGQTIAQQEVMQQLMREMLTSGSIGSNASEQLKAVDQMIDAMKKDLINKNITGELIARQNSILTKLLEAEKAEMEREYEDKRESKAAVNQKLSKPDGYFDVLDKNTNEKEFIRHDNLKMKIFYDQKYNSFINRLKN